MHGMGSMDSGAGGALGMGEGGVDGGMDGVSDGVSDGTLEGGVDGEFDTVGCAVGHPHVVGWNVGRQVVGRALLGCVVGPADGSTDGNSVEFTSRTGKEPISSALEGPPPLILSIRLEEMGVRTNTSATNVAMPTAANVETATSIADSHLLLSLSRDARLYNP